MAMSDTKAKIKITQALKYKEIGSDLTDQEKAGGEAMTKLIEMEARVDIIQEECKFCGWTGRWTDLENGKCPDCGETI